MATTEQNTIELQAGDPRLGTFAEDGSIDTWPELSIIDRPYERHNATIQRITGTDFFVVVPPDRGRFLGEVRIV